MDKMTDLQYLISGNNRFGRVNLSRATAAAAVKKAKELVQESYMEVRISTPRGRVLLSDEFDQLEG
jgi:cobalamin biosynthesis protein CbiD